MQWEWHFQELIWPKSKCFVMLLSPGWKTPPIPQISCLHATWTSRKGKNWKKKKCQHGKNWTTLFSGLIDKKISEAGKCFCFFFGDTRKLMRLSMEMDLGSHQQMQVIVGSCVEIINMYFQFREPQNENYAAGRSEEKHKWKPNDTQRTTINNICNVNNDKASKTISNPSTTGGTERAHWWIAQAHQSPGHLAYHLIRVLR